MLLFIMIGGDINIYSIYINYKCDFSDYVLLIRSGNFYVCLNNDAFVISKIMNYKIVECKNFLKIGFPIDSLQKVVLFLSSNSVNYLVIDKEIISKEKFKVNNYNNFLDTNNYIIKNNRINKIAEILKNNINNNNGW